MYVERKDLKRILRALSVWIYPPGAKYLFQLPPPKMGKHGIPKEEIKMQIEDRDEGPATRTKYLIPYEKANDFIYKYCTEISKGLATKEQIIEVAYYCIQDLKVDRGTLTLQKNKKIAEILDIKRETYDYRKRAMRRSGFFKKYNYEFGK